MSTGLLRSHSMWLAFEHLNFIEIVQIIIGLKVALVFAKLTHDISLVEGLSACNLALLFDVALWIFVDPIWISRFDIIEFSLVMCWIWSNGLFILTWNNFLFVMLYFLISLIKKMVLRSARFAIHVFEVFLHILHLVLLVHLSVDLLFTTHSSLVYCLLWYLVVHLSHVDVRCASWAVEAGEFAHAWDVGASAGEALLEMIVFLNFEIRCAWNSWLLLDKRHFAYRENLLSQIRL